MKNERILMKRKKCIIMNLSSSETNKYFQRQIKINNFNQEKLKKTTLIVGLGGTGTHIALACVRLGIQEIKIIDKENIESSNLNRQILYTKQDIGLSKTQVSKKNLIRNNISSKIHSHEMDVFKNWPTFLNLLKNSDFVFNCLDLPMIKRLAIASACLYFEKPMIYAGIDVVTANSGMLLFQPPKGKPCYECLESCLPQIDEKYHDIFDPNHIIKLNRINIEEIQEKDNLIASSNYYIASLISNFAINMMIQYVQEWRIIPNRVILDALNWKIESFNLNRSEFCSIC